MEKSINSFLKFRKQQGLLRSLKTLIPLEFGRVQYRKKIYENFSSNDYLGLASHSYLKKSAKESLKVNVASSASRLMTGSTIMHENLEKKIARFKGKEAALVFNSGYQANVGILSACLSSKDAVFSDRLNHASIVDGIMLSGAKIYRFKHNDMEHLEKLLKKHRKKYKNAMIVTETVFSMDGDICPVNEIINLKKKYNCMLMVDEAHATGIFGKNGSGIVGEKNVAGDVDIIMGTFSKAMGGFGAYAATNKTMKKYLVNVCRSFIYSTSLPPSIIAINSAAIDVVKNEPFRREHLLENSEYLRKKLKSIGCRVLGQSQIIPIIIGDNNKVLELSRYLHGKNFWVTPVRPPTVPSGTARLRLSVTCDHSRLVLDRLVEAVNDF